MPLFAETCVNALIVALLGRNKTSANRRRNRETKNKRNGSMRSASKSSESEVCSMSYRPKSTKRRRAMNGSPEEGTSNRNAGME